MLQWYVLQAGFESNRFLSLLDFNQFLKDQMLCIIIRMQ